MLIIGCDYHPSVQQIAFVDSETGENGERRLLHKGGEAERFYRDLKLRGVSVRLGIEATGHARWFERLLRSWVSSYGLVIRPRLRLRECGSRRMTGWMRSCC
jgi:hypothetical protein